MTAQPSPDLPRWSHWLPARRFCRQSTTIISSPHPLDRADQDAAFLDSSTLRILTWNIAKNNHDRRWEQDFDRLLRQYQPQLVFLQEVRLCATTHHLPALTEHCWSFAPNFLDRYHNAFSGVLTAAPVDAHDRQSILTTHHEPIARTPKTVLLTEYPIAGQRSTLLTVNAHLINFVDLAKFQAQLDSLERRMARHEGAIIFAGDFNTWSRSRARLVQQMTQRLGLEQAIFPALDTLKIKRFLLSPPLDYIFYRGFRQSSGKAKVVGNLTSSDHSPLLVELSC